MLKAFVILLGLHIAVKAQKPYCNYSFLIHVNATHGNDSACYSSDYPCRTLAGALRKPSLNNSCIILADAQKLAENVTLDNVHSLLISGDSEQRPVTCDISRSVGLSFRNSRDVHFLNVSFYGCGTLQPSTSRTIRYHNEEFTPGLHAAIYFFRCLDVSFSLTLVNQSQGYGIVMYDTGGIVEFNRLEVSNGVQVPYLRNGTTVEGLASGGGVYIEYMYTGESKSDYNSGSRVTFVNCLFRHNVAEKSYSFPTTSKGRDHVPFGRGGGVTVFFRGSAEQNVLNFSQTDFYFNSALWGAGLFIEHHDASQGNNVTLQACNFEFNDAFYAGGGLRVGHIRDSIKTPSTLLLSSVRFQENEAFYGGAFSQYRDSDDRQEEEATTLLDCTMNQSSAIQGLSLSADFTTMIVKNLTIFQSSCRHYPGPYVCVGSVYLFSSYVEFHGTENEVCENSETAFVLDNSLLMVRNDSKLLFRKNVGTDGGALALYGHSSIVMEQSAELDFIENNATKRGAAMFVDIPGPPESRWDTTQLSPYACFFQLWPSPEEFKGSVRFVGNWAYENKASAIYSSSLQSCRRNDKPGVMDIFLGRSFTYKNQSSPLIVTNPVTLLISSATWGQVYPGKSFKPMVQLLDERNEAVSGTVKVALIRSDCNLYLQDSNYVSINGSIEMQIFGNVSSKDCTFDVEVDVPVGPSIKQTVTGVRMRECPFGYEIVANRCVCENNALEKGVYGCDNDTALVFIGRWASVEERTTFLCPTGYCRTDYNQSPVYFVLDPNNQCRENRLQSSVLCGTCAPSYSVPMFGGKCQDCAGKGSWWIWITVVIVFIISILIILLMLLPVDIYSGYLNAFLYSCQVIGLLIDSSQERDSFLSFFNALTTTDSVGDTFDGWCFYDGMDNLRKLVISYFFLFYASLFIALVCYVAKRNQDREFAGYFTRDRCFHSFAIISVLVYSVFARVTFMLLHPKRVGNRLRLFVQGDILFFEEPHLVIGIIALLVGIVILLGAPLLLLFTSWFCRMFASLASVMPVFDAFKLCYQTRPNRQYFAAFFFIWRALMWAIYVFSPEPGLRITLLSIACVAFLVLFLLLWPYKSNANNLFDAAILTNLVLVSIVSANVMQTYSSKQMERLNFVSLLLVFVPFFMLAGRIMWGLYTQAAGRPRRRVSDASGSDAPLYPPRVIRNDPDCYYRM